MENTNDKSVILEIGIDKLKAGLEKAADELFKSSYSNPVLDVLKQSVKEKEGEFKKIIDGIIVEVLGSPDFKAKMADIVIQNLVSAALKK